MAALPYIQLYVADYLADTMHLTTEEHGAYLLLIFNYWQTGKKIPKARLQRIARLSNDRWNSVEPSLAEFFNDDGEFWSHERIERDLESVRLSQCQRSAAGKASAEARKSKAKTKTQRNGSDRSTHEPISFNEIKTNKDTDTDTDTEKNISNTGVLDILSDDSKSSTLNENQKSSKPDYPDWFETIWQNYPQRSGGNDKRKAFHAAQARIKSGKDPGYLLNAVLRYVQFVRANGNWGTQYVMQAATFFGPGEHIDNPWRVNHAASQPSYRPSSNGGGLAHDDVTWAEELFKGDGDYGRPPSEQPAAAIEGDFSRVVSGHQR
jgi:uncharacterized protein YdaU (DUF1376 family)